MITLFGIKNCDTIKKTKKWLETQDLEYHFHDYRVDGIDETWLKNMLEQHGWEIILNKRGTTFRQLSDAQKADIDNTKALSLLTEYPAMIKRPILQRDSDSVVGFKESELSDTFC